MCCSPVIFITAYTDEVSERIHKQLPGAPVLTKPLYGDRLTDAHHGCRKCAKPAPLGRAVDLVFIRLQPPLDGQFQMPISSTAFQ